jgi:HTH-type transcriptional regulator, competence development regulator
VVEWRPDETLGDRIRIGRARKHLTLRQLAEAIHRSASFLSDIENGRRLPSDEVLKELATELDLDEDDLLAAAGRVAPEVSDYLRSNPEAARLFRALSTNRVGAQGVRRLIEQAGALPPAEDDARHRQR